MTPFPLFTQLVCVCVCTSACVCMRMCWPVSQVAGEDHLSLADQQVGDASCSLVFLCTQEVPLIHFLQAQREVAQASQQELAAVHPVRLALAHPCRRISRGPGTNSRLTGSSLSGIRCSQKKSPNTNKQNPIKEFFAFFFAFCFLLKKRGEIIPCMSWINSCNLSKAGKRSAVDSKL